MSTNLTSRIAGLSLAALLLAGCAPMTPPSTSQPTAPAAPATPVSAPCIVGDWSLDLADYEQQSLEYISNFDAPLEDFALSGFQNLSVRADGLFKLDTDIGSTVSIAIDGYLRVYAIQTTGFSTAQWTPGEPGTIALADWVDSLVTTGDAPEESGLGGGVGFGAIPFVTAVCDGDRLALSGPDLPLVSNWTRQN